MRAVILILIMAFQGHLCISQSLSVPQNYRFLALGDSYTIGTSVNVYDRWPAQLVDSLENFGFTNDTLAYLAQNGWTSGQLLNALNSSGLGNDFDLVSLLIGVNNQYTGGSLQNYVQDFRQLIQQAIQKAGGSPQRVIVLSIPDYAFTPFGQNFGNPATTSTEIDQFNLENKRITDSLGITYFNITDISRMGLTNTSLVAGDGLHPSAIQYSLWVDRILDNTLLTLNGRLTESTFFHPNPSQGILNFSHDVKAFSVYDTFGRQVHFATRERIVKLDLKPGLYFIRIERTDGRIVITRLVIN